MLLHMFDFVQTAVKGKACKQNLRRENFVFEFATVQKNDGKLQQYLSHSKFSLPKINLFFSFRFNHRLFVLCSFKCAVF